MKVPQKPLQFNLSDSAQLKRSFELLPRVLGHRGRYRHWEEQRSRQVPVPGVSHEDWWLATKLSRMPGRTSIPLKAIDGAICHFVNGEIIQAAVYQVDMVAGGQVSSPTALVNPDANDRYLVRSLVEEAIDMEHQGLLRSRKLGKKPVFEVTDLLSGRRAKGPSVLT
jgi:hypothetical protein